MLTYANGNVYDGEWMADKRHGHGIFTVEGEEEGGVMGARSMYEGMWSDGRRYFFFLFRRMTEYFTIFILIIWCENFSLNTN